MKKVILITLAPLLIIDACVTQSMNYKKTERVTAGAATQQTKQLHDPKTSLIISEGADHNLLIKTPSLQKNQNRQRPGGAGQKNELTVLF
jgi:hypothetical protein